MDVRAIIIGSTWFAVMFIAMTYVGIGGITLATSIATGLLVSVAFIVTFGVAFGLQASKEYAAIILTIKKQKTPPDTKPIKLSIGVLGFGRKLINTIPSLFFVLVK